MSQIIHITNDKPQYENLLCFCVKLDGQMKDLRVYDSAGTLDCRPFSITLVGNNVYQIVLNDTYGTGSPVSLQLAMYESAIDNTLLSTKWFSVYQGQIIPAKDPVLSVIGTEVQVGTVMMHPNGTGVAEITIDLPTSFPNINNDIIVEGNVVEMDGYNNEAHLWQIVPVYTDSYGEIKLKAVNRFNNNGTFLKVNWFAKQL